MKRSSRRAVLAAPLALALAAPPLLAQQPGTRRKVLRLAFTSAETSFDPARISDLYSRTVTPHIFESLYRYDHLARPVQVVPQLADGMPDVSEDFRVWTVRVKRGVHFADDPAFQGQPRELTAHDIVYPFKRLVDPANKSPTASGVLEERIVGLAALRQRALDEKKPFDYDAPVAGLQVLDRYTVRFTLEEPRPRFVTSALAASSTAGAQAREAVEFYGDNVGAHPVGTGPFRLARERWVRSSRIVLERNPQYREVLYDARPAADDAEGQAMLARFKGRRLPIVDEVEIAIIEETQPLWLAFASAEIDALVTNSGPLPPEFIGVAAPHGQIAPHLGKRGVRLMRTVRADAAMIVFNMEDAVVGGFAPGKVALRRAISLAYDIEREIRLIRRGQAIPAQSPVVPFTSGYDAGFKSPASDFDVARANALLDLYGYAARDAGGWRKGPDGQPLKITATTEPEQVYRDYNNLLRRCLKEIGIRVEFRIQQWPANLKQVQAGQFQLWMVGSSANDPDGQTALQRLYGPQSGQQNLARFKNAAFDRLYERMSGLPDGPEREQLFLEAKRIAAVYMPYRNLVHRIANELLHPWVHGYRRPVFWNDWWHFADVDTARAPAPLTR